MSEIHEDIPTWEDGEITLTSFSSRDKFGEYLINLFKLPGQYDFDKTSEEFIKEGVKFTQENVYCTAPFKSKDFIRYWDGEKAKCRKGLIVKSGDKSWYITRDYYMFLNFLPIFDKETQKFGFPKLRDAQYHMALYEILAEIYYRHCAILKKRQFGSSYFHMAKLINQLWFEEGVTLKVGAALKDYINEKGSWKFLNEYAGFLNEHTAWYRPMNPEKVMMWQQKIEVRKGGRKTQVGLKGTIQGMSFEKDATTGVGGPVKFFFHEEAGIAPKMNTTYEYLRPAMRAGLVTTGVFIAAGSVGDLDQCEPLKDMILNPEMNDIYSVESNLIDKKNTEGRSGLFIPEQWSMPPFIDEYGNSQVEEALEALDEQFEKWKKELTPEQYQLRISQHPRNIEEAFAYRKESLFPPNLVSAQLRRIEEKEYPYELLDLSRDEKFNIKAKETNKQPIKEFPISKRSENKEGALVVWERPIKDPKFGTYYASIDPVSAGKTTTSESLCSIYVMKAPVEVTKIGDDEHESYIEPDKIVAAWCGRFNDLKKTHQKLEMIIEWYNAWTVIENNISLFIQYMISQRKQKYLVPKNQILFLKELGSNTNVYQEYGWRNTGNLFKGHLLNYSIEYLREELDVETKPDGTIVRTKYGVERIPDPMLLREMREYQPGLNVDRLIAFTALIAFMTIQNSNRGYNKRTISDDVSKNLQKSDNLFKLKYSPFRNMGRGRMVNGKVFKKSAFKNLK